MNFLKVHGLSNDFLVFEHDDSIDYPSLARRCCARHTGVGADGLLTVSKTENQWRLRIFNADGSEAEMSGNGIRCAAAFICYRYQVPETLRIETLSGLKTLRRVSVESNIYYFEVDMGVPLFRPSQIPIKLPENLEQVVDQSIYLSSGERIKITSVSMGNPHCSVFVDDFDFDWQFVGRELESHQLFPARTNVEFVRVLDSKTLQVRFWERGVGVTSSSGTGACAAAVAAMLKGLTEERVKVEMPAGSLLIERSLNGRISFEGPAEIVFEGRCI